MTALRDLVAPHRSDQLAMIELASSCGIGSTQVAERAYDVALPVVLDRFSEAVATEAGAALLHTLSQRLTRYERSRAITLFGAPDHPLGRLAAEEVFGSALPSVRVDVARTAGLGTADRLIDIISAVCLASAAGSGERAADFHAFVVTIASGEVVDAAPVPLAPPPGVAVPAVGPSVALPLATSPTPPASLSAPTPGLVPVADMPPPVAIVGSGPLDGSVIEETDKRSRIPWLLAGAAVLLLLVLIVGFVVFGGGDEPGESDGALVSDTVAEAADGQFENGTTA